MALFPFIPLVAQEPSTPTGFQLIDLLTTLGVSGVFVFLYFDERKERRQAQTQTSQMLERIIPVLTEATATLERVQASMKIEVQSSTRNTEVQHLTTEIHGLLEELKQRKD